VRLTVLAFWLSICTLFSLFLATETWIGALAIAGMLIIAVVALIELRSLAIVWLIGIPTLFVFPNNIIQALPLLTVDRLLFVTLAGILIVRSGFEKIQRNALCAVEWAIMLFLAYVFVNWLFTSVDKPMSVIRVDAALYVQGLAMPMLSFFIARRIVWRNADVDIVFNLCIGAGIFLVIAGALQFLFGITVFVPTYLDVIHPGRATGTFAHAREYGSVLCGFTLIALVQYVRCEDAFLRVATLVTALLMLLGTAFSLTRAPLVGLAIGLLYLYVNDVRARPLLTLGFFACMVAVAIGSWFLLDLDAVGRRFTDMSPIYNRVALYATALNTWIHNPVFGVGFGRWSFVDARPGYLVGIGSISAEWAVDVGPPHSEYLHLLVMTGIVGITLYGSVVYRIYRSLRQCLQQEVAGNPVPRDAARCVSAIFLSYLVNGFFGDLMFFNYFGILVFFLVGIVSSLSEQSGTERRADRPLEAV
jgi:O-antigen ligase